ncbi:MAG: phosphonate metabolism protein/1,5-bisphosphokinase (PRPP-forming) PhnN [Rhizobiales bacterium]|nr:phosphonate metabolism protein/1,5-bisphosphokinase (PRPP-forming) PhnN [Hyphomicrobiales bacterium]
MNWSAKPSSVQQARPALIGPGRLVLVVGPSGAGKDTLIDGARATCRDDPSFVFPRRLVTRPSSEFEDHDTMSEASFDQAVTERQFAFWWSAHRLRYGIPASIDDDIRTDRTVVCNVSRTIVAAVRERYARVAVVMITAPSEVLAARLAARDRAGDGEIAGRMARSTTIDQNFHADFVISNVCRRENGVRRLLNVICEQDFHISS